MEAGIRRNLAARGKAAIYAENGYVAILNENCGLRLDCEFGVGRVGKQRLYTIGYEGADIGDFIATLSACGVGQVIDIRDVPVSRKKGFSKNALAEALAGSGIAYTHLKGLGDPKPGREAARRGDIGEFKKIFSRHMRTKPAQSDLALAVESAETMVSCLLCFERSPTHCHRTIVATAMAEDGRFVIQHVGVQDREALSTGKRNDRNRAMAVG